MRLPLLQQAGVQMLRYPGGSYGDIYNWQDNTAPGGYVAPGTAFDSFVGAVLTLPGNWPDSVVAAGDSADWNKTGQPGDTMVNAGTDNPLVAAHAVRNANGDLSVMLINKDPVNSYQVNLDYAGFTPASGGTVDKYEVYRRSGTDSELLGTSTPVTFTTSTAAANLPGQLGLERDLVREWPGGHRDEPELGRDARGGRREHG